jgi:hypothetical protein
MPISGLSGEGSCNDFQQTGCGGTKLLLEFTFKIGAFSIHERWLFQFDA